MKFRQIHLDFHTSEAIDGIGSKFSKKQFQETLEVGHVDSITVFAKCHHGWMYYPSKVSEIHPHLHIDLLNEMINAAKEIDVKTPIYISAGFDEKAAREHPEWIIRRKDTSSSWESDFFRAGYHRMCYNSPYLDLLVAQVEEVLTNYDTEIIFLDISSVQECYCHNCIKTLIAEGNDPRDIQAVKALGERVYANYTRKIQEVIDKVKPGTGVFHNGGHLKHGRRDLITMNSHMEVESLPTGGWGYDHFPLSARYVQGLGVELGMDFNGMTGKFHTTWGEFGGYKHPNALRFETALIIANGGHCSIGDQLHPEGIMDEATYTLIGEAYEEVERKEEWCKEVTSIADIALLTTQAVSESFSRTDKTDVGASRMLLEGNYLFDVVDLYSDFDKYKVLILPDSIRMTKVLQDKVDRYLGNGGKILATGESGLNEKGEDFSINLGVEYLGKNEFRPAYFRPDFKLKSFKDAAFVFYGQGEKIKVTNGKELASRENPYFNRDIKAFCSHQHTPSTNKYAGPGMVESPNGIYIAWSVFEDYAVKGSLILKEVVYEALNRLVGANKTLETNLPAQGITTLMHQKNSQRYIHHMLYASPVKRGEGIEVIEDILPLYDTKVNVRLPQKIKKVYLAPEMQAINFHMDEGMVTYTVPKFTCHQMVVLEY